MVLTEKEEKKLFVEGNRKKSAIIYQALSNTRWFWSNENEKKIVDIWKSFFPERGTKSSGEWWNPHPWRDLKST